MAVRLVCVWPLQVSIMSTMTWQETNQYERIVRLWPLFGPHLEAALCAVLRAEQAALARACDAVAPNMIMPGGAARGGMPGALRGREGGREGLRCMSRIHMVHSKYSPTNQPTNHLTMTTHSAASSSS